jgi:YesN/AraC family two-component response regulator
MKKLRVLIADDHETVRKGVCAILTSRDDIEVCAEARNGEEAVRLTKELHPDIVLMDFTMPVLDGLEASRQILRTFP